MSPHMKQKHLRGHSKSHFVHRFTQIKEINLILCVLLASHASFAADSTPVPSATPSSSSTPNSQFPPQPTPPWLSPADELKTFQVPDGYRMELVMSEPDIREPVLCVFDGNGRMYVSEMRSYMQDSDATGEQKPTSLVSRHESTKGDGVFDRYTVFAGNLVLPRMVLPMEKDAVIISLTNTNDLSIYRDSKGDGVSDKVEPFYKGGPREGNLEHQPCGPLWCMDNWLYVTANPYRLRWKPDGPPLKEATPANGGQWGITQDDYGKIWWSNAGGEKPLYHFQTPVIYGAIDVPDQFETGFMEVWPATGLADFQGGPGRVRPDKTLNHFTGCCGQEVFRGDRLPADLRGDVLLPEPVGRMIRRAKVTVQDGITHLSNPYQPQHSEFIRSTDPYFRPVWTTTGPDGCLYIVDMYRGIIQEGAWTKKGSYLRKIIDQYGLQKVTGSGRIWRLVHKDFTPGPQPHMFDETSAQLVTHIEHPNGWWRDQAQKLLVLRQDKSVVPALIKMTRSSTNPLGRIQALWTLEGLDAADPALLREMFKADDPHMRAAAIRVSESLFKNGDQSLKPDVKALVNDPDPSVVIQALGTAKVLKWPGWELQALSTIGSSSSHGVKEIGHEILYTPENFDRGVFAASEVTRLQKGREIYQQLCFACHGMDGHGMPMEGQPPGTTLAPPLAGSATVLGPREGMISVLLHGTIGPVNGKNYIAAMPPMGTNNDEWVASVVSYVRSGFDNGAPLVTPEQVAGLRAASAGRVQPWTHEELKSAMPQPLANDQEWKITVANPASGTLVIAGKLTTTCSIGTAQSPGEWLQIELPAETLVSAVFLDAGNPDNFPRSYKLELSGDGATWGKPVAEGTGTGKLTQITFTPGSAKFIRITETGSKRKPWSFSKIQVLTPALTPALSVAEGAAK